MTAPDHPPTLVDLAARGLHDFDPDALFWLLRFGRKSSGLWDEQQGSIPHEDKARDIHDALKAIPPLLAALRALADSMDAKGPNVTGHWCASELRALLGEAAR